MFNKNKIIDEIRDNRSELLEALENIKGKSDADILPVLEDIKRRELKTLESRIR